MNSRWMQLSIRALSKFSTPTKASILNSRLLRQKSVFNSRVTYANAAIPNAARFQPDNAIISVNLPQIGESAFPTVWLRDNCQCPECFHQDSQSRTVNLLTFNPDVAPHKITADGKELSISWEDGHQSTYSYNWLTERSFDSQAQKKWLTEVYRNPKVPWTAKDFNTILFKARFHNLMNNDAQLKLWLERLSKYGVAMVTETPGEETSVRQLAERVGFIRRTHYGEEFSVKAKPGTTNVAYLSANLQLHTDLPYYHYKPGVNLLHCLVQSKGEGGENLLADVLAVAEDLRENDPETFSAITSTVVDWNDIGQENGNYFHKIHREPVISLDRWGNVERINFSQPQRDSHFPVPIEQVVPWYKAMQTFVSAIHSDKFCVKYKMEPGDILTFDNTRLVHGRSAYEESTNRHILGAYLDWDEIRSRLRVLRK